MQAPLLATSERAGPCGPWIWAPGTVKIHFLFLKSPSPSSHPRLYNLLWQTQDTTKRVNGSVPISRGWTQNQMWPVVWTGRCTERRAGHPPLPHLPGEAEESPWGPGCWRTPPSNTQRRRMEVSKQEKPARPSNVGRKLPNSFAASRPALGFYWERKQDSKENRRKGRTALWTFPFPLLSVASLTCWKSSLVN